MTDTVRRSLQWLVIALVIGFWLWFVVRHGAELAAYPWPAATAGSVAALALSEGAAVLYFLGLALGWTLLLRRMGEPMPWGRGARIWFSSTFMRYVPGNVWHVVGRVVLGGAAGASKTRLLVSTTVEQVLTLLGAVVVLAFSLPGWPWLTLSQAGLPTGQEDASSFAGYWLLLILVPLGLIVLHPIVLERSLNLALRLARRPPLRLDLRYADILLLLAWYAATTALSGLSLCLVVAGLTSLPLAHWPMVIGVAAGAWAIGYLSFLTPTGLGVREGAMTALLALIVPLPVAAVASLLARLVSSLGEAACVVSANGATWWRLRRQPDQPQETQRRGRS